MGGYSSLSRPAVEIELKDGRVLREQASGVPGDPGNPVGREVIEAKFRDCIAFGARSVTSSNVDAVIERLRDLENVDDVASIVGLMA